MSMLGKSNKSRATISDVARLADVSISTVSRVVNETAPVSDEVEQRVRSAVEMLNYVPHVAARNLATKKTNTIGLLLPALGSSFFAPMLRGIETAVHQTEFDLLVYANPKRSQRNGTIRRPQPIGEHNADGMIVFTNILEDDEIRHFYKRDFPLVLLYQRPPANVTVPSIMFDNITGLHDVVNHLVTVHHKRRIAFLRGPEGNPDSDLREMAFREALATHGIPYDPSLVACGNFTEAGGEQAVAELLSSGFHFDAIFTGDDESGTGALMALRQAGLHVPQDIAVIGFDDVPVARHLNPPLTTVRAPIEQSGYMAAQILCQLIETGQVDDPERVLPAEFVIRQSCGCP
jgi:LacI family transcriptional regulator